MAATSYLAKKLLDHALGTEAFTMPETVYVELSSTEPTRTGGNVTPPTFTGYERQASSFEEAVDEGNPEKSAAYNTNILEFGDPDSEGSARYFVIYDAAEDGNALWVGALSGTVTWQGEDVQDPISFQPGDLRVVMG